MPVVEPVPRLSPGVIALLVVLLALGLGAAAVGVMVALGNEDSSEPPVAATAAAPARAGGGPVDPEGSEAPQGPEKQDSSGTTSMAREVLREWDRRREAAWVAADQDALGALYLPEAVAGRRDVELLRRWTDRGVHITRLQPQVLELRVVRDAPRLLVVCLTDRLGVVEARVAGERVTLPRDRATTRRIELRRGPAVTSRWRIAAVRGLEGPGSLGG